MEVLQELRTLLEKEVEKVVKKGEITPAELESVARAVKTMCKIDELERSGGYSGRSRYSYDSTRSMSGGRYYDDRFRGDWPYSYDRSGRSGDGYSGHDSKESMVQSLRMMMSNASSDRERSVLADTIDRIMER